MECIVSYGSWHFYRRQSNISFDNENLLSTIFFVLDFATSRPNISVFKVGSITDTQSYTLWITKITCQYFWSCFRYYDNEYKDIFVVSRNHYEEIIATSIVVMGYETACNITPNNEVHRCCIFSYNMILYTWHLFLFLSHTQTRM